MNNINTRDNSGFTLLELLITLLVTALLIALGGPSFSSQIEKNQVKTTALRLLESMELTRTQAVAANTRTTMKAHTSWTNGWDIFMDGNGNGIREENEKLLLSSEAIERALIAANQPVKHYISYIGSGESRLEGSPDKGGFQAGTLSICPKLTGSGYQLVLARGGRVRMQEIDAVRCNSYRK